MDQHARTLRLLLLASIAAAIPVVLWKRDRPGLALACSVALGVAVTGPRLLRRAGVPMGEGLELLWLLPFSACWGLGEGAALFSRLTWWDAVPHTLGGMAVAALFLAWGRRCVRSEPALLLAFAVLLALGVGALWELGEFAADGLFGTQTQAGLADTMGDLCFDLLGGATAVLVYAVARMVLPNASRLFARPP